MRYHASKETLVNGIVFLQLKRYTLRNQNLRFQISEYWTIIMSSTMTRLLSKSHCHCWKPLTTEYALKNRSDLCSQYCVSLASLNSDMRDFFSNTSIENRASIRDCIYEIQWGVITHPRHDPGIDANEFGASKDIIGYLMSSRRTQSAVTLLKAALRAVFMGPTWGPSCAERTQVGPMLVPWASLSRQELNN